MIYAVALVLAAAGDASPVMQVETLRCGTVEYRMASEVAPGGTLPLAPVSQTLTRQHGDRQQPVHLDRGPTVVIGEHRVLGRYVSSWACLTGGHKMHYALIGYACTVDPGQPGDCGGEKEWFRLLDTRGRFADTGVPHDGPARARLYAGLGLNGAMSAGVKMIPVVR